MGFVRDLAQHATLERRLGILACVALLLPVPAGCGEAQPPGGARSDRVAESGGDKRAAADGVVRALVPAELAPALGELEDRYPALEVVAYADADALAERIPEAEVLIAWGVEPRAFRAAKRLRWVHLLSGGVDNVLWIPELRDAPDIRLTSTKIQKGPEVADHAMALLLALTRSLPGYLRNMQARSWDGAEALPLVELRGKTMLILGLGGVGVQVAERAHASGMRVIATDPKDIPLMGAVDYVAKPDQLDALLPEADVVVSCVPATPATQGLLNADAFASMKHGVYFVNVSRGSVVVTDALVAALRTGKVRAAGLDVVDPEPLPAEHPLWSMPNVILTPHRAGASDGGARRRRALALRNVARYLDGLPLENRVDKQLAY